MRINHRSKRPRVLRLLVSLAMVLGLLATSIGGAQAASQTLVIYGANGVPGTTDPYTQFSMDNGVTWQQAYLFGWHPWGFVPGTNSWINCAPSGLAPQCLNRAVLYRIQFNVPAGATNPHMVFDVKADNQADIWVNGTYATSIVGQNSANIDASVTGTIHPGLNEIRLNVIDWGGWAGMNYKITLTMDAPTPPTQVVPVADTTPPTITATRTPAANASGWNNTDVAVSFACADTGSGVASCTGPVVVSTEGAGQSVTGNAADVAGNTASATVSGINIDKTAPTISGAADRAANAAGWYNADVSVGFTCADALSGVASCSAATTLGEGANQSGTGNAADVAGNTASATVSGVNVDKTAPTVTYSGNAGTYSVDQQVAIRCAAADALSGVASTTCTDVSAPAYSLGLGAHTYSATASDVAGNTGTGSTSLTVTVDTNSLCALTQQFVTKHGVAHSLCEKLKEVAADAAHGDDKRGDDKHGDGKRGDDKANKEKAEKIQAYIHEVNAQAGKSMTQAQAAILIQLANSL